MQEPRRGREYKKCCAGGGVIVVPGTATACGSYEVRRLLCPRQGWINKVSLAACGTLKYAAAGVEQNV